MSKVTSNTSTAVVGWKEVRVFVSSTFDDMHAERDYLVKEVFPRLREWCEQRRLRLVDVDLRWGVTEADATNNKRVVDVCLRRIDDCRPFFICLLGQRYGWIPRRQDVADDTVGTYPHVRGVLGAASVTEMEIQHSTVEGKRTQDAFFYLREPSWLADLPADPAQLRQRVYTDESETDGTHRREKLRVLREVRIPATGRPVRHYSAQWDPDSRTPALALPPQCPATLPENVEAWRKNWQRWADVHVAGLDVNEDAAQGAIAEAHNEKLTRGRLGDFAVGQRPLGEVILEDLKQAIADRFPDHVAAGEQSELQRELDLQDELIAAANEGFIGRAGDLAALDAHVDSDDTRLFAVAAAGGIGKTTLLAKWIADRRNRGDAVFCRFIGVGDRSSNVDSLLASLLDELREAGCIESEIPTDPKKLREKLPELLAECANHGRAIIVIDALNQLDSGLGDLEWLPKSMPDGLKLVVSFKTGTAVADEMLAQWRSDNIAVHECHGFEHIEDRKKLVTGYLERHLKELDQLHLEALVTVPGAENPLYLRVVLGELRVFGAFGQLREKLRDDFGTTPIEAFAGVLRRLESDPAHAAVPPATSVPLIFGFLAHAHGGLPEPAIVDLVHTEVRLGLERRGEVAASVALVLRQLRPYLAHREGRVDFFYESLQIAAQQRYTRADVQWPVRSGSAWNDALATWCMKWDGLEGTSKRYALRWLPTHLVDARRAGDAAGVMTEFGYHYARLRAFGAGDVTPVIQEFATLRKTMAGATPDRARTDAALTERVTMWERFLHERAHLFKRESPSPETLLLSHAYAHGDDSAPSKSAERWMRSAGSTGLWLRVLGRPGRVIHGPCLRTFEGHSSVVTTVVLHPDGRRVVSGSWDATVRVWDIETGACLRTLEAPAWLEVVVLTADGQRVVAGGRNGKLWVWNLETGTLLQTLEAHTDGVWAAAPTADARHVVSGGQDRALRVWDLETGASVRTLAGHSGPVCAVVVTADGHCAVSGSWDGTLRVWDITSGECLRTIKVNAGSATAVALTADARQMISRGRDNVLRVWELESGAHLRTLAATGQADSLKAMALTGDGRRAVLGNLDNTLQLWDLESGARLCTLDGHAGAVTAVALTADGRRAVSGSQDSSLRLWDLDTNQCKHLVEKHTEGVHTVALTADGRRAVSGSWDKTLRVWDLETGQCLHALTGHASQVSAVALTADGRRVVSGSDDNTLRVWDLETGQCLRTLDGPGLDPSVVLTPDCRHAVAGGSDQTVGVWNLETGMRLLTLVGHKSWVRVALTADGRRVVSGSGDNTLRVWDIHSRQCLHTLEGHTDAVYTVATFAHGLRAASTSADHTLRVWNLETGQCLRTLTGHTGKVRALALMASGLRAVSGSEDCTLRVWDIESGLCLHVLRGHTNDVNAVAVTAGGRKAVSASFDMTVRVWNLDTGECLATLPWDTSLRCCSACDDQVIVGADDGSVLLLMPPGRLLPFPLCHAWHPSRPLLAVARSNGTILVHVWHPSSGYLEELVCSAPISDAISSLRMSLDGTRLQVLTTDNTEHILDATTLQPAPPPTCAWSSARDTSPDGAWRAVIRDGRLVVEAAKP